MQLLEAQYKVSVSDTSGVTHLVSRLFLNKYDCCFSRTPECNVLALQTLYDQKVSLLGSYNRHLVDSTTLFVRVNNDLLLYIYGGLLFLRLDFIHLNFSFTHLTFLFCKASLWKSASTPRRGKQGKETDRDVVHCDFSLSPIVVASCYNYFSFFSTNILSSLSEIELFRLVRGSVVLLYAKSFLNPILYTTRMPGFR